MSTDPYAAHRAASAETYIPLPEVAARMGRSPSWVYERAKASELPFPVERIGSRYLARRRLFDRYERGGEDAAPAPVAPIALVVQARAERDLALAAIDRRLVEHEREMALLRFQRELLLGQSAIATKAVS